MREVHIVDHHPLMRALEANQTFEGDSVGAATTLLVEQLIERGVAITGLDATLLALGIYEDTGSLVYAETTPRDLRAAAWLIEQGAVLDDLRRFLEPPLNEAQQTLLETLIATADSRSIQGYTVTVAAAHLDHYLNEVSSVAHRLRDTLDPAALFLLVQMPGALHLVCRSTEDAIDAGAVARFFGGGGHERAAAATLHDDYTLDSAVAALWAQLAKLVQPAARVADLMSQGAQTVDASAKLESVVRKLRRIGHEGFPVVEAGHIVGLLTRRDADRALEHGLGDLRVRDVMSAGEITLRPDDSVALLEQRMVESGWGQIPVVGSDGRLIGIVTRTDLIQHWAQAHPAAPLAETVSSEQIAAVLGEAAARLIDRIAEAAQAENDQPLHGWRRGARPAAPARQRRHRLRGRRRRHSLRRNAASPLRRRDPQLPPVWYGDVDSGKLVTRRRGSARSRRFRQCPQRVLRASHRLAHRLQRLDQAGLAAA